VAPQFQRPALKGFINTGNFTEEGSIMETSRISQLPGIRGLPLSIREVGKRFGGTTVLKGVNLHIREGECVAIVGRSGCGKSTLLRLIAGLDQPTEGSIRIGAQPVRGIPQDVRVLFQDSRLLPWKRVIDNVRLGTSDRDRNTALHALEQVGLAEKASAWPSTLSGGQRQRVALARALVAKPRLLLLDEPLGALDALTRLEMQRLIERLWQEFRFTLVLVTHDVSEAVTLADRVVLIDQGNIDWEVNISLARPRIKDSGFAWFEQTILDRLLNGTMSSAAEERQRSVTFSI
jgi:sulfonate transport system ATP-binding protein